VGASDPGLVHGLDDRLGGGACGTGLPEVGTVAPAPGGRAGSESQARAPAAAPTTRPRGSAAVPIDR
jgi:hypothetical protein